MILVGFLQPLKCIVAFADCVVNVGDDGVVLSFVRGLHQLSRDFERLAMAARQPIHPTAFICSGGIRLRSPQKRERQVLAYDQKYGTTSPLYEEIRAKYPDW